MDEQTQAITTASPSDVVMARTMFGGLDELTDEQFETLMRRAQIGLDRTKEIQRRMMRAGVHYIIPGEQDPKKIKAAVEAGKAVGLSKAGCELLWTMHGLAPGEPITVVDYGDGAAAPAMTVRAKVPIHRGDCSGPVIAWGIGMCSTHEDKYRWRDGKLACPECGEPLMTSRYQSKDPVMLEALGARFPLYCNRNRGGCGREFNPDDTRIKTQTVGRVEHPNPLDLANTIVKMATKRATTDGTIKATRSSDLWSPDVEDMGAYEMEKFKQQAEHPTRDAGQADVVDGDPDAWREAVDQGEMNAAPESRVSTAPEPKPDPASESQMKFVSDLLRTRYGCQDAAKADSMLAGINLNIHGQQYRVKNGVRGLTKTEARAVIELLKSLPPMTSEPATA